MTKTAKTATLYRMMMGQHVCPYGLKAKALLERKGFTVDDRWLTSRAEVDAFKQKHNVQTTPQVFIEGVRIGGYDDLRSHLGLRVLKKGETTYRPVVALFSVALLMALAISHVAADMSVGHVLERFIAVAMCLLGVQKLMDVESFSTMFVNYDLLARTNVRYAYVYPFAETLAGVLMLAGVLTWFAAPLALFIGGIGAVSVFKAVYIDKRELKCACVGGTSSVPLGFVSLTENVLMVAMALWMLFTMMMAA